MKAFKVFIKPFEAPQGANQLTVFYMRAAVAPNGLCTVVYSQYYLTTLRSRGSSIQELVSLFVFLMS